MFEKKHELSSAEIEKIESICIFCWGLLGDVFLRTPLIEAIREKFPDAKITIVTNAVRAFNPGTTNYEIFYLNRSYKGELKTFIQKIMSLRKKRFDLSIDLYGGGSSPLISYLVSAKIRLSFNHKFKLRASNNLLANYPLEVNHWTISLGKMLAPLAISHHSIKTDVVYECDDYNRGQVKKLFDEHEKYYIGINLGAGSPAKIWPMQNVVELLMEVGARVDIMPVVFFNPGQEKLSEQFMVLYPEACVSLKGKSFEQEAAALECCDILITGDTSLMHLAVGVKTPVFALFLATRPEAVQPEHNPFHACLIEDTEKELINGFYPVVNKIPVSLAVSEFVNFTEMKLNWMYPRA